MFNEILIAVDNDDIDSLRNVIFNIKLYISTLYFHQHESYYQLLNDYISLALNNAATLGRCNLVLELLQHHPSLTRVNFHGQNALQSASAHGHHEVVSAILQYVKKKCSRGLLEWYVNLKDDSGYTALFDACRFERYQVVEVLIDECGSDLDLNQKCNDLRPMDTKSYDIKNLLYLNNADVTKRDLKFLFSSNGIKHEPSGESQFQRK